MRWNLRPTSTPPVFLAVVSPAELPAARTMAVESSWHFVAVESPQPGALPPIAPDPAVILLDTCHGGSDWRLRVDDLSRQFPTSCIILASPVPDDYLFKEAVKHGAFDVVGKPLRPDELLRVSRLALAFWNHRRTPAVS